MPAASAVVHASIAWIDAARMTSETRRAPSAPAATLTPAPDWRSIRAANTEPPSASSATIIAKRPCASRWKPYHPPACAAALSVPVNASCSRRSFAAPSSTSAAPIATQTRRSRVGALREAAKARKAAAAKPPARKYRSRTWSGSAALPHRPSAPGSDGQDETAGQRVRDPVFHVGVPMEARDGLDDLD